jgi:hypothetical protein
VAPAALLHPSCVHEKCTFHSGERCAYGLLGLRRACLRSASRCARWCVQGADPTVVKDPVFYMNLETQKYERLDAATYAKIATPTSRL